MNIFREQIEHKSIFLLINLLPYISYLPNVQPAGRPNEVI